MIAKVKPASTIPPPPPTSVIICEFAFFIPDRRDSSMMTMTSRQVVIH
jgi:hypothetical protein